MAEIGGSSQSRGNRRGRSGGRVRPARGPKDEVIVQYLRSTEWHDHEDVIDMRGAQENSQRRSRPLVTLFAWARTVNAIMRVQIYDVDARTRVTTSFKGVGLFLGGWKPEWVKQAVKCGEFLEDDNNRQTIENLEKSHKAESRGMSWLYEQVIKEDERNVGRGAQHERNAGTGRGRVDSSSSSDDE